MPYGYGYTNQLYEFALLNLILKHFLKIQYVTILKKVTNNNLKLMNVAHVVLLKLLLQAHVYKQQIY